jgi:hypothetical protein
MRAIGVCAALLVAWACLADPVSIMLQGGAAAPVVAEPDIRMATEALTVDLYDAEAVVKADMVFVNEGPAKEILIGFPQVRYAQLPESARLHDVRMEADGQALSYSRMEPAEAKMIEAGSYGFEGWFVAPVRFEAGQERRVVISYRHEHGGAADFAYPARAPQVGLDGAWFPYLLATAARWKGTVGRIDATVAWHEGIHSLCTVSPEGYAQDDAARRLTWRFEDYDGKPEYLVVWFWQRRLEVLVDGQPAPKGFHAGLTAEGAVVDVAKAECLGLRWLYSGALEGYIEMGERKLAVKPEQRQARLDKDPFELTLPPGADVWPGMGRRCLVAAEDLKRAFGIEWSYDAAAHRLSFTKAPAQAQAAAPAPGG